MDMLAIFIRASFTYLYILLALRLTGKRTIGNLTPMDFVVALILGDMFDNLIWSSTPVASSIVGIITLFSVHVLVSYASYKSPVIRQLVDSPPTKVVKDGVFMESGLDKERIPKDDVLSAMRLLGEDRLDEVETATWEPNGQMSLIKKRPAKTAQKDDKPLLEKLFQ